MKVLVLGGSGMLGHKLVQTLAADGSLDIHASVRSAPTLRMPDATYHEGVDCDAGSASLRDLLQRLEPDVVVNAIGAIKQKDLSAHAEETLHTNGLLPHLLAFLNPNPAGRVIHFSTDCVFVGDRGGYRQDDVPDATDLYGRSKAIGEIDWGRHLTLRTSIIGFELGGHLGLVAWLLKQPRGSTVRGFTRAIYSGLPTVVLSRLVRDLLVRGPELTGLYHVASEPIDKFDLLTRLNARLDLGLTVVPDDAFVMDRSMDDREFREATGTTRPGWNELIEEMGADWESLPYEDIYQGVRKA